MPPTATPQTFEIPGALRFATERGMTRAVIETPAAEAEIYLHGAHVTHWRPRGERPVLFLSSRSLLEAGKAIRGGVPVIFPWFGPRGEGKPGPMHGFARTAEWAVEGSRLGADGSVEIRFGLGPSDASRALGYDAFHLGFRVTAGATLGLELTIRNDGAQPMALEEALHTYFAIGDIHQVSVSGLAGCAYLDKTDGMQRKTQDDEPVRAAGEVDRVYLNTEAACVIQDAAWQRRIVVEKSGSRTTVVWNPWIEKTKTLSDMAPEEWRGMICVETANAADNKLQLDGGASRVMTAAISVGKL